GRLREALQETINGWDLPQRNEMLHLVGAPRLLCKVFESLQEIGQQLGTLQSLLERGGLDAATQRDATNYQKLLLDHAAVTIASSFDGRRTEWQAVLDRTLPKVADQQEVINRLAYIAQVTPDQFRQETLSQGFAREFADVEKSVFNLARQ